MTPTTEPAIGREVECVLEQAVKLTPRQRAELIERIDESLDTPEAQADIKADWVEEIHRRSDDIRLHPEQFITLDEFKAELQKFIESGCKE